MLSGFAGKVYPELFQLCHVVDPDILSYSNIRGYPIVFALFSCWRRRAHALVVSSTSGDMFFPLTPFMPLGYSHRLSNNKRTLNTRRTTTHI